MCLNKLEIASIVLQLQITGVQPLYMCVQCFPNEILSSGDIIVCYIHEQNVIDKIKGSISVMNSYLIFNPGNQI